MLKVLFIIFFFGYLIFLAWSLLFRMLGFNPNQRQKRYQQHQSRPKDGNVHIAFDPNEKTKKNRKSDFSGGDYVDYEEVK